MALAVILTASVMPASLNMRAAYAETFATFDGNDYVQVSSSPDLQLPKFTIEVKFRIQDLSSAREYLVSKAAGTGVGAIDHNYALYVTKYGSIAGGFRATDGNYYYVYSWQLQSLATWHVATLDYDGSQLTLEIDNKLARKLKVGSNPDTSGTGPMYIGRNSNGQNGFFVGDVDYVSIIDGRDNQKVYFNDFGTSTPANTAPVASNDWGWTYKNTSKKTNALSNDSDLDGDTLTITSATDPSKGSATNNGDGTITYMPDMNFVGTDSYQYIISDGKGGTDTASVTIQVRDTTTNNPPNAVNDSTGTTKNTQVTTNVLSNDSDPDGDTLTITSVTNPPHGSAVKNSGGTVTYTPDTGFVGTDSYQYTISDGAATDTATVTVSVSDPAPPPPTGSDCSDMPVKNMRGVVFNDGNLEKGERAKSGTVLTGYVTESFKYIKSNGFNTIRVPYYWEAYVNNPTVFMEELDLVARTADTYDLCVVFANFHFHTTSYWGIDHGKGFPSFMVKNFPNKNNNYIATAGPFWDAFLSNSIVVNGRNGWDLQGDFIKSVISKVDHYGSVAGYEILNEPHLFNKAM
ncbi:MAG: Ig-like domain-containing protein, partial [Nitrososphaera sp.]